MIEDAGRFDGRTLLWPDRDAYAGEGRFSLVTEEVLGEPLAVFRERPRSVRDLIVRSVGFGDRTAFVFPNDRMTFVAYADRVARLARWLERAWSVEPGDRIGILGANSAEWIVAYGAVVSVGAVAVALNGWWTANELRSAVELTAPRLVLADSRRRPLLEEAVSGAATRAASVEGEVSAALDAHPPQSVPLPDSVLGEDDPATILFTSGTTGRAKGAVHSHRNLIVLATCTDFASAGAPVDPDAPPCSLYLLPLFHVSGLHGGLIHTLLLGWKSVWMEGRFDERAVLEVSQRERVTSWSVVPAQLFRLLEFPDFEDFDLSTIQAVGGGGSAWPPALSELVAKKLPAAAPRMSFGFGQTESSGMGTANNGPPLAARPDSAGRPRPMSAVQIRDDEGEPCPEGVEGEICLRGPGVFLGYWQDPQATDAVLEDGRWLRTGDLGYIEEGLLFVSGRRSELVIRGGENVYPAEIEACLAEHPDVLEAAVYGLPHRVLGEEVGATVRLTDGSALAPDDVRQWVRERLAAFKVPEHLVLTDEPLPRNATGKIQKHRIPHRRAGAPDKYAGG